MSEEARVDDGDELYKSFLQEMETLERFRLTYSGLHPNAPLHREDQDVRRLIEAMAMFTARTRAAGRRAISRSTMRLFRQHFSYLLSPLPATAMLRAKLDARFVEIAEIPRGTEVILTPIIEVDPRLPVGTSPKVPSRLRFQTVAPLRLLPLALDRADIVRRGQKGFRITLEHSLTFSGAVPSNKELGTLKLYVNHLDDFASSLLVHHHLKTHLVQASVVFDERVTEETKGANCAVRFGAAETPAWQILGFEHPLQRARAALHHPESELFLEVEMPKPPRNWRTFSLVLDVSPAWPTALRLNADTFELHSTPIVNVARTMASPITADGTKERYLVQHPEPAAGYRVVEIAGVYRLDEDAMTPLQPGVIEGGKDTYEIENDGLGDRRRTWVSPHLPDAFDEPVRVAIDAYWHQPVFAGVDAPTEFRATLSDRHLEGVSWGLAGAVVPGTDNPLDEDQDRLLRLLSIKNQRLLELPEVTFLLEAIGIRAERHFRDLVPRIADVKISTKPFAKSTTGFKYIYQLDFAELDRTMLPLLDLFAKKVLEILRVWSTEDVVELEVSIPNLETKLSFSSSRKELA